jgi:hypothetical protein
MLLFVVLWYPAEAPSPKSWCRPAANHVYQSFSD